MCPQFVKNVEGQNQSHLSIVCKFQGEIRATQPNFCHQQDNNKIVKARVLNLSKMLFENVSHNFHFFRKFQGEIRATQPCSIDEQGYTKKFSTIG